MATLLKFFAKLYIIFDDAIVDERELALVIKMWVGIAIGWSAMGCPASMSDAAMRIRDSGECGFEIAEFSSALLDPEWFTLGYGESDSSGVIPAIFESTKTFKNWGECARLAGVSNDATHLARLLNTL